METIKLILAWIGVAILSGTVMALGVWVADLISNTL